MEYVNKQILISGGSSGIGFALAKQLVASGAHVTIIARDKQRLLSASTSLKQIRRFDGQQINWISTDVSKFVTLSKKIGGYANHVDVLINSAGLAYPGKFIDLSPEIFRQLIEVNYLGTVNLTKLVVPHMIAKKSGYILNISSLAALVGIYGYTAYAPTKFAIRGFSKCLRSELKPYNIIVSVVLPPDTDTPQLKFERSLLPDITRKINAGGGLMSAEAVAEKIITGMRKKRFTILPSFEARLIYLFAPIIDRALFHYAVKLAKKEII